MSSRRPFEQDANLYHMNLLVATRSSLTMSCNFQLVKTGELVTRAYPLRMSSVHVSSIAPRLTAYCQDHLAFLQVKQDPS